MKTKGGIIEAAMKYRQIVILIVSLMFFLGIYALIKMPNGAAGSSDSRLSGSHFR